MVNIDELVVWDTSIYQFELPVDGSQCSEILNMGIELGPFQFGDTWRGANLPEGWCIENQQKLKRSYICDGRKRARVIIYTKKNVHMRLLQRFSYGQDSCVENSDENVLFCIWDAGVKYPEKSKVIFEAAHKVPSRKRHKDVHESQVKIYYNEFEKKAREWLLNNFPNWENNESYWSD